MRGFLKNSGISRMKKDFDVLLGSPEATAITLNYLASHTGTWDPDEGAYDGGTGTWASLSLKAILKIITMYDKLLINTGAVTVGDCIFFINRTTDIGALLDSNEKRWYFTDRDIKWYPINTDPLVAENAIVPLGVSQMSQSIPCKRKEKAVAEPVSDTGSAGTGDGITW